MSAGHGASRGPEPAPEPVPEPAQSGAESGAGYGVDRAAEPKPEHGDSGDAPRSERGRRLHPVTPWRRAWAPIAALAGFAAQDPERTRTWFEALSLGWLLMILAVALPAAAGYGFLSWWVTSFSVTDTELRIRTGLLFRRAAHIRLDRIQAIDVTRPLLARVFGVAKLKLDVVGAEQKDELAFLGDDEARDLRAELLARAAGMAPDAAAEVGEAPATQLVRIAPRMLVVSLLLSGGAWAALGALLVLPPVVWFASGSLWATLAITLPGVGAAWGSTLGRLLREYDWTVADSPDGLRLDHGLLDREHATVPPGRVQAVRIVEPLLWRRRDWVRVELEVAGGGDGSGVLLPVAPRELADAVLARVLPEIDLVAAADSTTRPPSRARWCSPVLWRGYGHGATESAFVARHGRLRRVLAVVPHAKVQSVRLTQGPWESRLGLADIHVDHGADGAVTARLRDLAAARAAVAAQAVRSRTGRRTARHDRWLV